MFLAIFRGSADSLSYRVPAAPNPEAKHTISCHLIKICGMGCVNRWGIAQVEIPWAQVLTWFWWAPPNRTGTLRAIPQTGSYPCRKALEERREL